MDIRWDSEKYSADFSFVHEYGNDVLDLVDWSRARTVLDLGCGNGALAIRMRDKGLRVTGLDASAEMLSQARRNAPDIPFVLADATDFTLPEPVDVVFSNAVLHWIEAERQPRLLACVARALRPGGQFVFEMGGHGNTATILDAVRQAFAERGLACPLSFFLPTVGDFAPVVERAGFTVREAMLFDRPTRLRGEEGLADWIRMFAKAPFAALEKGMADDIVNVVVDRLRARLWHDAAWHADYVRLRMRAVRR